MIWPKPHALKSSEGLNLRCLFLGTQTSHKKGSHAQLGRCLLCWQAGWLGGFRQLWDPRQWAEVQIHLVSLRATQADRHDVERIQGPVDIELWH